MLRKLKFNLMDGAMGTLLMQHGVPLNSCFEELNETHPTLIAEIHRSYLAAGAQVIVTHTFGANRIRLGKKAQKLERWNRMAVKTAKKVAGRAKVFASVGPLGPEARKLPQKQMIRCFQEQIRALEKEQPDGYLVETMTTLTEAEAATLAVREQSDRLLLTSMSFPHGFRRTVGAMELISTTLREAGASVIGINCGLHPEECFNFLNLFRRVDPGPWLARPAAGLPTRPVFPEEFAKWGARLAALGVQYIGGCCGTTPAHIRMLKEKLGFPRVSKPAL